MPGASLLQRGVGAMGVELGTRSVRLVQLRHGTSDTGIEQQVTAGAVELPADCDVAGPGYHGVAGEALAELLGRIEPVGRRVVTALPVEAMQFQNMRLPVMPADELAEAVRWEVAEAGEGREVRYFVAGEVRHGEQRQLELVVMSASATYLEAHVAMLERVGLVPTAIDVVPAALARGLPRVASDGEGAVMVADVRPDATNVVISRAGAVRFFKAIPIGVEELGETRGGEGSAPS
ncbi:MAG: hypothetical protein WD009_12160, partial [Phycisphaeraceae bacterium]